MTFTNTYSYGIAAGRKGTVLDADPCTIHRFFQQMGGRRPQSNAVVRRINPAIGNTYILAAVDVDPGSVESMVIFPVSVHIASVNTYSLRIKDKEAPIGGIGQFNVLNANILAIYEPNHL